MSEKSNIYLIGFMGCGKTSVSLAMHKKYGKTVVEADDIIVEKVGMSINEIFAQHGEEYFRDQETAVLVDMADQKDVIVSCGGGMILRPQNVSLMKENGVIVLLDATPETILERLKDDDSRPKLRGRKTVEGIQELKSKRAAAYAGAADLTIDTDGKTIEEVAEELYASVHRAR